MMATKRLIDANAAVELLRSLGSRDYRREKGTIADAMKMLSHPAYTPTVDAAEVVHGRWIHDENVIRGLSEHQYVCSVCTHIYWNARIPNFKYCPNCGAKMDL